MVKKAVPNMFTLSNLACGIMSIMMTFNSSPENKIYYMWACFFIICAALMDRYDGKVARYLDVSSEIGKELDSLADLVSFGVAPAILTYNLFNLSHMRIIGYLLLLVFPLAGAYRLARYNITSFDGVYSGVPITIAGMFMALYCLVCTCLHIYNMKLTVLLMLLFSYLMVSTIKLKKV